MCQFCDWKTGQSFKKTESCNSQNVVGGEKEFPLHSSDLLAETSCNKRQINKRKTSLFMGIPHVSIRDTQKNQVAP